MANFRPKKPVGGTEPPNTDTLEAFLRMALDKFTVEEVPAELSETDEASPSKQTR